MNTIERNLEYLEKCEQLYNEHNSKRILAVQQAIAELNRFAGLKHGNVQDAMNTMIVHYDVRIRAIITAYFVDRKLRERREV